MLTPIAESDRAEREAAPVATSRLAGADKSQIVDMYDDAVSAVWARVAPTLGLITVRAVLQRALHLAKERHPALAHVAITERGLSFDGLRADLRDLERSALIESLRGLVGNMCDILSRLSGSILVDQVQQELESIEEMGWAPGPGASPVEKGSGDE
ncbi:MAG: hypothetical protein ACE5R4_14020 [Armatimonadota bacterium]